MASVTQPALPGLAGPACPRCGHSKALEHRWEYDSLRERWDYACKVCSCLAHNSPRGDRMIRTSVRRRHVTIRRRITTAQLAASGIAIVPTEDTVPFRDRYPFTIRIDRPDCSGWESYATRRQARAAALRWYRRP